MIRVCPEWDIDRENLCLETMVQKKRDLWICPKCEKAREKTRKITRKSRFYPVIPQKYSIFSYKLGRDYYYQGNSIICRNEKVGKEFGDYNDAVTVDKLRFKDM